MAGSTGVLGHLVKLSTRLDRFSVPARAGIGLDRGYDTLLFESFECETVFVFFKLYQRTYRSERDETTVTMSSYWKDLNKRVSHPWARPRKQKDNAPSNFKSLNKKVFQVEKFRSSAVSNARIGSNCYTTIFTRGNWKWAGWTFSSARPDRSLSQIKCLTRTVLFVRDRNFRFGSYETTGVTLICLNSLSSYSMWKWFRLFLSYISVDIVWKRQKQFDIQTIQTKECDTRGLTLCPISPIWS